MAAAQSELSMDEILASIRRIIHEEEEPQAKAPRDDTNTVDLRSELSRAAELAQPEPEAKAAAEPDVQHREVQVTSTPSAPVEPTGLTSGLVEEETIAPADDDVFDPAPLSVLAVEKAPVTERVVAAPAPEEIAEDVSEALLSEPVVEDELLPASELAPQNDEPLADVRSPEEELTDRVVASLLSESKADGVAAAFATLKRNVEVASAAPRTLEGMVEDMLRPMLQTWLDENLQGLDEKKVEAEIQRLSGR